MAVSYYEESVLSFFISDLNCWRNNLKTVLISLTMVKMVRHPPLALRERRWSLSDMSRVIAHRNCQELARRRNWRCRAQQWVSFIILKKVEIAFGFLGSLWE